MSTHHHDINVEALITSNGDNDFVRGGSAVENRVLNRDGRVDYEIRVKRMKTWCCGDAVDDDSIARVRVQRANVD